MRYPRSRRAAAIVGLSVLAFGAQASLSAGEEPGGQTYGMVEAVDPLVGFDWAPAVADADVAAAAASGAVVTDAPCTFGDRPGVLNPIFRRPIRTTGHLVVTPSGNVSFICHAVADARSLQRPLPTQAIVVDPVPCFLPGGRRTNDSHLVVTPSLHVQLVCHFMPAG
jgi:hypothetical protein